MESFFADLPLPINALFIFIALFVVIRASHALIDGAVYMAHEFKISSLVIGATVVAMGTSSAELAVNLSVVLSGSDTSAVAGNILGSNLINYGIGLGIPALIVGLITVPRGVLERDMPMYIAATGLVTALIFDGQITPLEAILLLLLFAVVVRLIIQSARARSEQSVLLVEITEAEALTHPTALHMTRRQALLALFGGLGVLVVASRLLLMNTEVVAEALHIPHFIIGLLIVGPGTSLPEIASAIQSARQGQGDLVLGMAVGSNLFNLLFGLGLPALFRPLAVGDTATQSFFFLNLINITLLMLLLFDFDWLGHNRTFNRAIGTYLFISYVGFIAFQLVITAGGTPENGLLLGLALALIVAAPLAVWRLRDACAVLRAEQAANGRKILCATRGGQDSQATHETAIAMASEQEAELLFLYVFDPRSLRRVATPIVFNVNEQIKRMEAFLQNSALVQARQADVRARVVVRTGSLREQLEHVTREENINLIILGNPAKENSLFQREALQTLADEIEGATNASVLVLSKTK